MKQVRNLSLNAVLSIFLTEFMSNFSINSKSIFLIFIEVFSFLLLSIILSPIPSSVIKSKAKEQLPTKSSKLYLLKYYRAKKISASTNSVSLKKYYS